MTAEWLAGMLRGSGANRDASVESFESANIGEDMGVVCEVSRVDLNFERQEDGAPGRRRQSISGLDWAYPISNPESTPVPQLPVKSDTSRMALKSLPGSQW